MHTVLLFTFNLYNVKTILQKQNHFALISQIKMASLFFLDYEVMLGFSFIIHILNIT